VEELTFQEAGTHFELAVELAVPPSLCGDWSRGGEAWVRYEVAVGSRGRNGEVEILGETLFRCTGRSAPAATSQPSLFPQERTPPPSVRRGLPHAKTPAGWRKIANKTTEGNDYFQSETSDWNIVFRVGPGRSVLANLPEDRERFPVGLWVRDTLRNGVTALAFDIAEMRKPASPSAQRGFVPDGSSLPHVISELRDTDPGRFAQWVDHVRAVLEDIRTVDVIERPEDNHAFVVLEERGSSRLVPSWLLSDGTLRLLALTIVPYLTREPAIYLVEEPENGIHPKAIDAVFDSLSSVYEGHVSVATHSPLILGLAARRREQILCFAKSTSGATDIVRGDQHPALRHWEGEPDLSILYAAGVLG
jgi:hypothetical protein